MHSVEQDAARRRNWRIHQLRMIYSVANQAFDWPNAGTVRELVEAELIMLKAETHKQRREAL